MKHTTKDWAGCGENIAWVALTLAVIYSLMTAGIGMLA